MTVKELSFENFRNLENNIIFPSDGINVIYGDNAQGKTNILECLWLFTGGRSFRGSKESELVNFDNDFSKIHLKFEARDREQEINIMVKGGRRYAELNDVKKNYISQIVGSFCCVVFSPNHLTLIKNGPEERRKFIDGAICQIKPSYSSVLSKYHKILNERNALLKDIKYHSELMDMLEIWDERLSTQGAIISIERISYMKSFSEFCSEFYSGISKGIEKMDISYKLSYSNEVVSDVYILKEKLQKMLIKSQQNDIYQGYTGVGPHRDDLSVMINGKNARNFGSQGQQRSAVLAMKLAEASVLKYENGEQPVILLDDVLSELDSKRQDYLLNELSEKQVFITCCESEIMAKLKEGKKALFYINCGTVKPVPLGNKIQSNGGIEL